jgi:hypothetical protein
MLNTEVSVELWQEIYVWAGTRARFPIYRSAMGQSGNRKL